MSIHDERTFISVTEDEQQPFNEWLSTKIQVVAVSRARGTLN